MRRARAPIGLESLLRRVVAACAASLLLLSVGVVLPACAGEDRSPEGTAKLFLRAVSEGDTAEVFHLLDPDAQAMLIRLTALANAQTGGGEQLKPEQPLAAGQEPPHFETNEVQLVEIKGDSARVRLLSKKKGAGEVLSLIRVKGVWRVRLPSELLSTTPATRPAQAPASIPATTRPTPQPAKE